MTTPLDPARLLAEATPGPWHVAPPDDPGAGQVQCEDGHYIDPNGDGDARLMAAAPDLARRCIALEAMFTARLHGIAARLGALPQESCPHPDAPAEATAWLDGWVSQDAVERCVALEAAARRVLALTGEESDEDQDAAFAALRAALEEER